MIFVHQNGLVYKNNHYKENEELVDIVRKTRVTLRFSSGLSHTSLIDLAFYHEYVSSAV